VEEGINEVSNMIYCQNCGSPVSGNFCGTCGQSIAQMQAPYQQPPKGNESTVIAIVVGIIVVMVILAAILLLLPEPDKPSNNDLIETETTPRGALMFSDDPNVNNKYIGQFQGSVKLDYIDVSILDASTGQVNVLQAPTDDFTMTTPGGLNLTFDDVQQDRKMDASDIFIITGGGPGDKVTIVWRSTGETVATDTL
jgi:hypothetical protein